MKIFTIFNLQQLWPNLISYKSQRYEQCKCVSNCCNSGQELHWFWESPTMIFAESSRALYAKREDLFNNNAPTHREKGPQHAVTIQIYICIAYFCSFLSSIKLNFDAWIREKTTIDPKFLFHSKGLWSHRRTCDLEIMRL